MDPVKRPFDRDYLLQEVKPEIEKPLTARTVAVVREFFDRLDCLIQQQSPPPEKGPQVADALKTVFTSIHIKLTEGMKWGWLQKIASFWKNIFTCQGIGSSPHLLFRAMSEGAKQGYVDDLNQKLNIKIMELKYHSYGLSLIQAEYKPLIEALKQEIPASSEECKYTHELALFAAFDVVSRKIEHPFYIDGKNGDSWYQGSHDQDYHKQAKVNLNKIGAGDFQKESFLITETYFNQLMELMCKCQNQSDLDSITEAFTMLFVTCEVGSMQKCTAPFKIALQEAKNRLGYKT